MNNATISLDYSAPVEDIAPKLRAEESRIVKIIEAIRGLQESKDWETLKVEIFDNLVNVLEKDLFNEAKKEDSDIRKLNRLSGELKWAERYSDLLKLENIYKVQLQNIRTKLYGKQE